MMSSKLQQLLKLSGIFPVLKPAGLTSAQLLNRLREKLYSGTFLIPLKSCAAVPVGRNIYFTLLQLPWK